MIKLITAKIFTVAIEVDEQNKIINAPRKFSNFLNLPFNILEDALRKQKFQSVKIENVE